ncbi:MAG: LysE family transporter [Ferruginibacter sp.]
MKITSSVRSAMAGGFTVSFLGSLPPGAMTITSVFIVSGKGIAAAWSYSLGSMIAELIIVWLVLYAMGWLRKWRHLFFWLELFTAAMLALMTIACFYAAGSKTGAAFTGFDYGFTPFVTGFMLSILNPIHISFWMGWSLVLMNKNVLKPSGKNHYGYLAGIGSGSLLGFAVYINGGNYIIETFSKNQSIISLLAGFLLLFICCMQVKKMVLQPARSRYTNYFERK